MPNKALRALLAVSMAVFIFSSFRTETAHAVACSSGAPAQNNITVVPSHGSVFYIDTGVTPKLDAGFIGYKVTNSTGSTQSDLWTEVSSFTGGKLALSNALDSRMQLPSLANGANGTSYFMLKSTGASTLAQTHTVKVWNHRPDLAGAVLYYECVYSFSKVQETIKAAANKVDDNGLNTANPIEVSDTSPELGQLLTITVEGVTGNIGSGSTPDFDIFWMTPAAVSTWPTRSLRLESVSAVFDLNGNWGTVGDQVSYTNQLLITGADAVIDQSEYRLTYNFRVIGVPTSTVKVVPVAQIASGTQVKHTDIGATGGTLDISFAPLVVNASLTKSVVSTTGLTVVPCTGACVVPGKSSSGETYVEVPYRLTASTTSTSQMIVDEYVDTPAVEIIFKPSSATVTDMTRSNAAIADPVYIASESLLNPRPYHFIGPFTMSSTATATIDYKMYVPVGSFSNLAYAKVGDLRIGATSSAMSRITVSSSGTSTIGVVSDTVDFSIAAITDPATDITTTAATLNGNVDPNGTAIVTGQFEYGTSPTLVGATTVTATTPASGNLNGLTVPTPVSYGVTGLSSGTTYYFRVKAGSSQGEILSFTTQAVVAPPTVTTTAATTVSATNSTLNGTINPNLTALTAIQFIYGTSPTLASGNTTTTIGDGEPVEGALTAGGSSEQPFSKAIASLTPGTTYYFKIRACTASSGTYPTITCSAFVDGGILSFVAASAPTVTTVAATQVGVTTARLNGTVNPNGATATNTFVYGTAADLLSGTTTVTYGTVPGSSASNTSIVVTGLTASTTYYFRADAVNSSGSASGAILNFTTSAAGSTPRTLTIDAGSYNASYSATATPPTITSTPSAGGGVKTYTSTTTGVCTIGSLSGTVTFVSAGTCTIDADIATDGTYVDADAPDISFDVTLAPRWLSIDASSYVSTYSTTSTPPTITSTATAGGGTKSYTSLTTGVCTINSSSGLVAFVTAGTCTIDADITSDGFYDAAAADAISFNVTLAPRWLSIDSGSYNGTYTMVATPPTITSTATAGGGTKSYTSTTLGVCTINSSSGLVAFVAPGTCSIDADITADTTYAAADADDISFSVTLAPRTLTIDAGSFVSTYSATSTPPTITSTASAGAGTKSYTSVTPSICTINSSSGLVAFVTAGTCTIDADITTDGTYAAADALDISFDVTLAPRWLSIDPGSFNGTYTMVATPPTITSTPTAGGGTKSYTSTTLGVCTINSSSGLVAFVAPGTCSIDADITADTTYAAADADDISFSVTLAPRTLTIDPGSFTSTYSTTSTPPTITSTPSAGVGTKTYTSVTPSVCTINSSSGLVAFVTAGTCTIDADIASDGNYVAADATDISFSVTLAPRWLTIDSGSYNPSYTLIATPPTITSTATAGGGTKSYTSTTLGVCTINGSSGLVAFVSAGTCSIDADITADATYDTADAPDISFAVTLAPRTLTIDPGSFNATYSTTATPPTITSTPSAGAGTKSYTSVTPSICTINSSSGLVAFVTAGTCTIDADITSDGTYVAADADDISFSITLAPRTLTIDPGSFTSTYSTTSTPPTITSTASAGVGTKSYTSVTPGVCTINSSSGLVAFVTAGTCTIDADITADSTYNDADAPDISFSVTLAPRWLSIDPGSFNATYSTTATPPTITSTATAGGGTKSYTSTTTGVCTINSSSGLVAFVTAGTCSIDADITADTTYAAADADDISFSVTLAPRTLTIDPGSFTSTYSTTSTPPTITSTPSAGVGTKTYTSMTTGVCTINSSSGLVAFVTAGTCTIDADIASDGTFNAADATDISFSVTLAPRWLSIDSGSYDPSYTMTDTPPTITSTPTAGGGTKSYASTTPGVCTINSSSGLVAFVATGTCSIDADITADTTYAAADADDISFSVTLAPRTLTIDAGSYTSTYSTTSTPPTITSTPSAGGGTKSYASTTPGVCTINPSSGLVAFVTAGTCTIDADIEADGTYDDADATDISFDVTLAPRWLHIDPGSFVSTYTLIDPPPTITSTVTSGTGTKSFSSSTPGVCTINPSTGLVAFVSAGTCTIGSSITADGTYDDATATSVSFSVTLAPRTITIDAASYEDSYFSTDTPPILTSTASAGAGAKTYTSSSTATCTVGASSGLVDFVANGTCVIFVEIETDGLYADATSPSISFTIGPRPSSRPRTPSSLSVTINSDASCTASRNVTVTVQASDATDVMLSNDPLFIGGTWQAFTTPDDIAWTLTSGNGTKTVYAQWRNEAELSDAVSDTITLDTTNLCGPPPSTPGPGGSPPPSTPPPSTPPPGTPPPSTPPPTTPPPPAPPVVCDLCAHLSYDLYIINPDGTERHTGTPYVKVTDQGSGVKRYAFEDATLDVSNSNFDHNDVVVDADLKDCSNVKFIFVSAEAGWKHQVRFKVIIDGVPFSDTLVAADDDSALGTTRTFNASRGTETLACPAGSVLPPVTMPPVLLPGEPAGCSADLAFVSGLTTGSTGPEVLALQRFLQCLGYFPPTVTPNGVFGPTTGASLRAFEAAHGLPADVTADAATRALLNAIAGLTQATPPPVVPPQAACDLCSKLAYDLYIINPDGTERHTGTPWVKVTDLGNNVKRYAFEDATIDPANDNFDHNDVIIEIDASNCAALLLRFRGSDASWRHQVRLSVLLGGTEVTDTLVVSDDDTALGTAVRLDATRNVPVSAACTVPAAGPVSTPVPGASTAACRIRAPLTRLLTVGSAGADVRDLQDTLKCRGFFPADVTPTGTFGPVTRRAVLAFQAANGIGPVGFVGPQTRAALNR